jgi:hypothetical protein
MSIMLSYIKTKNVQQKMIKKIDTIDEGLYTFLSNDDTYSSETHSWMHIITDNTECVYLFSLD